jgi:putative alpha-1,2-mannosidase
LAKGLGKSDEFARWSNRCTNYRNVYNPNSQCDGFSGFADGRHPDGSFWNCTPNACNSTPFYEASPYEMSFNVPHDMAGVIQEMGGEETFIAKLENGVAKGYATPWSYVNFNNQPGYWPPLGFCWTARPDKTSYWLRKIQRTYFYTDYPQEEDSGAHACHAAFIVLGLYPINGTDVYLLTGPAVKSATFQFKNGNTLVIEGQNATADTVNMYVQSATLNGKPFDQCWIRDYQLKQGGTLSFVMGPNPSTWAQNGPRPPSYSTDGIPDRVLPTSTGTKQPAIGRPNSAVRKAQAFDGKVTLYAINGRQLSGVTPTRVGQFNKPGMARGVYIVKSSSGAASTMRKTIVFGK